MKDRFGIFGTVIRFRELSLVLVMMLRIPNIALASDVAALSRPNGKAPFEANSPCGSSLAVGESARGASPPVVGRSSRH